MKHKKPSVHTKPWTPFQRVNLSGQKTGTVKALMDMDAPAGDWVNSRYHVGVWEGGSDTHPMGKWYHLSIKDHDRSARHDWRDFQRIKNELVGHEYEAIEIYPRESQLVDMSNQYHLFVFETWRMPMAFPERMVADQTQSRHAPNAKQRPFEVRPPDCMSGEELDRMMEAHVRQQHPGETQ